jgi:hypothetical protein
MVGTKILLALITSVTPDFGIAVIKKQSIGALPHYGWAFTLPPPTCVV